ncbi:hypothetical protein C0J52_21335 [Blattella germanica]|nr:hypothetical protein C0J52_21335 [Blattella germanica]
MARETQHTSRNNSIKVNSLFYAFSNTNRYCSCAVRMTPITFVHSGLERSVPHPLPSRNRIYCRVAFDLYRLFWCIFA